MVGFVVELVVIHATSPMPLVRFFVHLQHELQIINRSLTSSNKSSKRSCEDSLRAEFVDTPAVALVLCRAPLCRTT